METVPHRGGRWHSQGGALRQAGWGPEPPGLLGVVPAHGPFYTN